MIQEIQPRKFYNQFRTPDISAKDYILIFHDNLIFVKDDPEELDFLRYGDFLAWREKAYDGTESREGENDKEDNKEDNKEAARDARFSFTYLFAIDEQKYFLLREETELRIEGFAYRKMFEIRRFCPKHQVMAAATAWHLSRWYRDNRYCGRCGKETVEDHEERMLKCPHCGNMIYPKVAPAVIVGVVDGDRILMTKYNGREYKRYALIAGFNEIGETIEETVRREVMEEVGLHVKNIRYYKSQPWGFDSNLLLGFFCELSDTGKIHMDEKELSVAEWVRREDVPDYEEHLSLTHEMMQLFKSGTL